MASASDWGDADIAVIGMAGRFPGANDIKGFWQNLCDGVESIRPLEAAELATRGVAPELLNDPQYVKAAAVMDGIEQFDAAFFGYTPREAELMDPQHRLFLECAYHTLEHAGYDPERFPGAIAVFGGGTTNTYLLFNLLSNQATLSAFDPMQIDVSNATDFVATRVSYKLNLKGPSFTVQTACSTSLVAIHLACQSLLNEECDMALAGGVSVHVKHPEGYWYQDGGNVSPDGHCRAFDAQGAGTVFGSGVAAVLLKRLPDALADGDHIHAVVKGSALNNDGAHKVGFTAPSVDGQAEVITEALALADIAAADIAYVETHGTATKLGDPIEVRALTKAFRNDTDARQFCAIGSVKSNLGHLASAAGVTSFIKTVLMLEHGRIPPSLHFQQPNPAIDFATSPFYVNTSLAEWPVENTPRRAGVSSFGVGGTNAHAVLQAAPPAKPGSPARPWQLLLLSAASPAALDTASTNLVAHLRATPGLNLADAAYTLQIGRQVFGQRRMVICQNASDAASALEGHTAGLVVSGSTQMQDRPVAFLLPGMGDQYANMALELYQHEPTFRAALDRCADLLLPLLGQDVRQVLYPQGTAVVASTSAPANGHVDLRAMLRRNGDATAQGSAPINQVALAHPILFAVEYALAQLWLEWGITPRAMIGHSVGEYVAACLAGVFRLDDALKLVARRAQLIEQLPAGAMLAVLLPEADVQARLGENLWLAAVNAPGACVVSGTPAAVATLQQALLADGIACQPVQASRAFHSPLMAAIEAPLLDLLGQITLSPPRIPFYSNVTGALISAAEATDPAYWARHMRQTVRFADGVQALLAQPGLALLELGPGQTLTALTKQHPAYTAEHVVLATLRQPHQAQPDGAVLLGTLGRLWLAGVTIGWEGFYTHERRRRAVLPGYPFERQRYWIDASSTPAAPAPPPQAAPGRTTDLSSWFYHPTWQRTPAPTSSRQPPATATPWLLFADETGLSEALHQRLVASGQAVTLVQHGSEFRQLAPQHYSCDLTRRDDYGALLSDLAARGEFPSMVLHCASLLADAGPGVANQPYFGFYSLAFLAQALEEHGQAQALNLWVLSNQVQLIESGDQADPVRATILSPCRVIPQEFPQMTCRLIDINPAMGEAGRTRQVAQLLAEIARPNQALVAYRGTQRWVPQFVPLDLPASRDLASTSLRHHGVYLVVEGLVGVGWALAQLLAQTASARLVLLEAPGFPAPDDWANWLATHDPADAISTKISRVRLLQAQGGQVLVLAADSTSLPAMQAALGQAVSHFDRLHGVIHTLGSVGGETFLPLQELNYSTAAAQLDPPATRLSVLAQALATYELDFCMLTSSLSAVLGGLGQAAHAAASLLMDTLAERQSQAGSTPWLSVDWDIWQPEGEDLAALPNAPLTPYIITPAEGVAAAERLLAHLPGSRVVVSTGNLALRLAQRPTVLAPALGSTQVGHVAQHPRPQLASAFVAPRSELERTIANTWQDVFGMEQIGIDDNFFELGGNSLIAIHAMGRLKKTLQVSVPTAMLYQRPTIRFLAELLAQDEDQAAAEMAERLAKRKAELGRRNQVMQRRRS